MIAITSVLMIFFLFVLSLLYEQSSNYIGLFTYIIIPVFLIIGLVLIPIGMIGQKKKQKDPEAARARKSWIIDLTNKD